MGQESQRSVLVSPAVWPASQINSFQAALTSVDVVTWRTFTQHVSSKVQVNHVITLNTDEQTSLRLVHVRSCVCVRICACIRVCAWLYSCARGSVCVCGRMYPSYIYTQYLPTVYPSNIIHVYLVCILVTSVKFLFLIMALQIFLVFFSLLLPEIYLFVVLENNNPLRFYCQCFSVVASSKADLFSTCHLSLSVEIWLSWGTSPISRVHVQRQIMSP